MVEQVTAPVQMRIKYKVDRTPEREWTYQVTMNFHFDDYPDLCIKDKLLVESGVYTFKNENEAKIQAKRISKEFQEYFAKETALLIETVMSEQVLNF